MKAESWYAVGRGAEDKPKTAEKTNKFIRSPWTSGNGRR